MLGSNSPRMLSIGLPVVDSWNVWWSIYDNSVERFAEVKAGVDAAMPEGPHLSGPHLSGPHQRSQRRGNGGGAGHVAEW